MTANSAVVRHDSEAGVVVLLYGDASDLVFRRLSLDDGLTWEAAEAVQYGAGQLDATLLSLTQNPRSGKFHLACSISGDTKVLTSEDLCLGFVLSL